MNRLACHPGRGGYTPRIEALEDRCVLNAVITGVGHIVTTGSVNHVLITDDGATIRVFADNSPWAALVMCSYGAPLTVSTKNPGSTNLITYEVLGPVPKVSTSPGGTTAVAQAPPTIYGNLDVNFGSGIGQLWAQVLADLPTNLGSGFAHSYAPDGDLGGGNLKITTSGSGFTDVSFVGVNIGPSATVQLTDNGGNSGNNFLVQLNGRQDPGSQVNMTFQGGNGHDQVLVGDFQAIQPGATAVFNLDGQAGKDQIDVTAPPRSAWGSNSSPAAAAPSPPPRRADRAATP
jgi:hypothetical protein